VSKIEESPQESAVGIATALEQVYNDPTASNVIEESDLRIIRRVAKKLLAYSDATEFNPDSKPVGPNHDQFGDHNNFNCMAMAATLGEEQSAQFVFPLPQKQAWLKHLPGCQRCICFIASLMFSEPSEETLEQALATGNELSKIGVALTGKN
jgi:hypothetical protein